MQTFRERPRAHSHRPRSCRPRDRCWRREWESPHTTNRRSGSLMTPLHGASNKSGRTLLFTIRRPESGPCPGDDRQVPPRKLPQNSRSKSNYHCSSQKRRICIENSQTASCRIFSALLHSDSWHQPDSERSAHALGISKSVRTHPRREPLKRWPFVLISISRKCLGIRFRGWHAENKSSSAVACPMKCHPHQHEDTL